MRSTRIGRRFVPQSTIDRRVQAKDDRLNAALAAFRQRTQGVRMFAPAPEAAQSFHSFLTAPTTGPILDAMIADNEATDARILAEREERLDDDGDGSACGTACGFCGRCS